METRKLIYGGSSNNSNGKQNTIKCHPKDEWELKRTIKAIENEILTTVGTR